MNRETKALWKEISDLKNELASGETKITRRRATGARLLELLSTEKNRNKLADFAIASAMEKGKSHSNAKRYAITTLWTTIIESAFHSASKLVHDGKCKLTADDVNLPLRLLHYSDKSSVGNRIKLESTCKLSQKSVKRIFSFCNDMLETDEARKLAEMDILNTLIFLCERVDYIAYIETKDILGILAAAEGGLNREDGAISTASARIFGAILESCQELGIGMHIFMGMSVRMVSRWCHKHNETAKSSPREQAFLFRGLIALLRVHPEQAIAPMKKYGKRILSYARRSYEYATSSNRHAIHGYLIAHIVVCQEAGRLRGLLPGELGNLSRASSIDREQLESLLAMVIPSLSKVELSLTIRKRVLWKGLDSTVQRHLELCCRLLACSQRMFLVGEEWELLSDPNDFFTRMTKELSRANKDDLMQLPPNKQYPVCPPDVLAKSPWISLVFQPILDSLPNIVSADVTFVESAMVLDQHSQCSPLDPTPVNNLQTFSHPMLDYMNASSSGNHQSTMDSKILTPLLLIISASAEAFPSGRCWTSSSQKYWKPLMPDENVRDDIMHVNGCAPEDFALLIHAVSKVLEAVGGPTGDPEIQILSLLCLIRLTDAHGVIVTCLGAKQLSDIELLWRQVWTTLFRSDLRYAACTANASEGSCGELVLILLTEMVHNWCTDPWMASSGSASEKQSTFLYRNQNQLWVLPTFSKGTLRRPKHTFELICVFLHRLGLSDEGKDNIQDSPPLLVADEGSNMDNEGQRVLGRRYRLVCLCLQTLECMDPVTILPKDIELLMVVTACMSALVNCQVSLKSRSFLDDSQYLSWTRSSIDEDLHCKLCFTELPDATVCSAKRKETDSQSSLFETLWTRPVADPGVSSLLKLRFMESLTPDTVVAEKSKLCYTVRSLDLQSPHVDYAPPTVSNPLNELLRSQMKSLLARWSTTCTDSKTEGNETDPNAMQVDSEKATQQAPLTMRCMWIKVALGTCVLSNEEAVSTQALEFLVDEIVAVLQKLNSGLPDLCENADEFYFVFLNLLQIFRFFSEISLAVRSVEIPSNLMKQFISLSGVCETLLSSTSGMGPSDQTLWDEDRNDEILPSSSESDDNHEATNQFDSLFDSDDEAAIPKQKAEKKKQNEKHQKQRGKRKASTGSEGQGKELSMPRKKRKRNLSPPDSACASLVGSILVLLDPSHTRCVFVIERLLRLNADGAGEVELAQAYHCLSLLEDTSVVFHDNAMARLVATSNPIDESFRHQSPFSIIKDVLDALRQNAQPSSMLHSYGFRLCGECVRMGEHEFRGMPLTAEESKNLVDLINSDEDAIDERPYLRLDQLRAATVAFQVGGENFHSFMDPTFPKLVQRSLQDPSSLIRKDACFAASAALDIMVEKKKVFNAVSKKIPPVSLPSSTGEADTSYQEWYQHFDLGSGDLDLETALWEDAHTSMEYEAIYCKSVVAGSYLESTENLLFDLVRIAALRPELEGACFYACEKIASMLGYKTTEEFLADQSEVILNQWIAEGLGFAEIPLLLSAPSVFRLLLETGQQSRLYLEKKLRNDSMGAEVGKIFDVANLQDVASDTFLERYRSFLIPSMLLRIVGARNQEGPESGILNDRYIQEFCVCLKGDHLPETVKKIFSSRLHDIEALCAPMVHSSLADSGKGILKLVSDLLEAEHGAEGNRSKPYLTVRRMLELSGKDRSRMFPAPITQEAFCEAIASLADKQKSKKKGDILSGAGLSITECFLYGRRWLDNATTDIQKEMRWSTISLLFDLMLAQIQRKEYKQCQLGFGINMVVDIALRSQLRCLRGKALALLKLTLDKVFGSAEPAELQEEFTLFIRRLVGALMKMHETCQQELVNHCRVTSREKLQAFERSLGFLANQIGQTGATDDGTSDPWGWDAATDNAPRIKLCDESLLEEDLREFKTADKENIIDAITGTYGLLMAIFDKASVVGLSSDYYVGCMPPYSVHKSVQEVLQSADPRFCAQKISQHFLKQFDGPQKQDLSASVRALLGKLRKRVSWIDSITEAPGPDQRFFDATSSESDHSLTLSQWMLRGELVQLEHTLRRRRSEGDFALSSEDLFYLVKELSFVCGASCPKVLSSTASRCLGELDIRCFSKVAMEDVEAGRDWMQVAMESDSLLLGIQADAIQVLSEYLHSQHPGVAITAVDTLIALFATRDGGACWELLDAQTQQNLLPVLSSKKRTTNANSLQLSVLQISAIKSKAMPDVDPLKTNFSWCWNQLFWQCRSDVKGAYDDWVCDLVPALIDCCYRCETGDRKGGGDFFFACQKMTSVAPKFASSVFPAIILDLLDRNANMLTSPASTLGLAAVLEDTWIGTADSDLHAKLSSSFETLLGKASLSMQNSSAVSLAIDTLDLLRRATQSRFLRSDGHKRNSSAIQDKKQSKSSRGSKSATKAIDSGADATEYNNDLGEPCIWKGVPYGVVLKIDGDLVVQACIDINRCASALFYSDLYFESALGGSGAIMERLASNFADESFKISAVGSTRTDISGYFMDAGISEASSLRVHAVNALESLGECYLQLHEEDAYHAVQRQKSDLQYAGCSSIVTVNEELTRALTPTLADLQRLDSLSNNLAINPIEASIQSAEMMEKLGLRTFLQSYVSSMEWSKVGSMTTKERRELREKCFESRLYGMEDFSLSLRKTIILGEAEIPREEMGFHEAVTNALGAFARDDLLSCEGHCDTARTSLLKSVSSLATGESSFASQLRILERLQSLNDIENLASESESPAELLQRWGFPLLLNDRNKGSSSGKLLWKTSYTSAEFLPCMQEITLRLIRSKAAGGNAVIQALDPQECLTQHLWSFSSWCRENRHLQMAEATLQRLRAAIRVSQTPASIEMVLGIRLQDANLSESKGDFAAAIRLSKQTISLLKQEKQRNGKASSIEYLLVDSLINCGRWLSGNKIEPAQVILDSYHKPSAFMATNLYRRNQTPENARRLLEAQIALASLASSLFDNISARVKSIEWLKSGRSLDDRKQELKQCLTMLQDVKAKHTKAAKSKSQKKELSRLQAEHLELMQYSKGLENEVLLSERQRTKTEKSLRAHLCLAMRAYASALSVAGTGHKGDMSRHIFRMVFLWFSNCTEGQEDTEVNAIMDQAIGEMPSYRFVSLTSQLCAQIDSGKSAFQTTLQKLVQKMCTEHPYHCLFQLISVCNGKEVGSGVGGRNASAFLENLSNTKVDAALQITKALKRAAPTYVGELLESYQTLMSAYITLANAPTAELVQKNQTKNIALSHASKSQRLDRCLSRRPDCPPCVLTKPPSLRSGGDYGDGLADPIGGERIQGFDSSFSITDTGLHRPKIVMCRGTKGGRFRQLVKGEDEIRQDAVMEQVFTYVNELMRRQDDGGATQSSRAETKASVRSSRQELRMVTYNIIPLSPASGVLEWVENSITFGDYILDTKASKGYNIGAHSRYYPGEWGHSRCRTHYVQSPAETKRESFDSVCKSFSPCFRFFFVERFGHSLKDWYAAKMKYTRSVAVSSIIGHILGIGDRHCSNVLVSQITGEVVHIDFGIVFEQGKLLTVPELVPFRLTRNMVDGFGPIGTEGTFARAAEQTAVVLRDSSNALLTILSAIASDPLYRWSVSPVEARRRQRLIDDDDQNNAPGEIIDGDPLLAATESKSERNEAAALVLAKIQEKLQGYEDGTSGEQQSIEGQVQLLINSADRKSVV